MLLLQNKFSLLALLLIPLIIWWHRYLARNGQRHIRFSSRRLIPDLPGASKASWIRGLFPFKIFAVFLFVIALAGPQIRHDYQIEQNRGIDILLTLDTSGSMGSIDFKPRNRLEVAKEVIAHFVEKRKTDRLGLIIFAATAYTKCPLTVDYEILKTYPPGDPARRAGGRDRHRHGSGHLDQPHPFPSAKTKIIILLTDGNNNRGEIDPRDAASMAKDFNIKVYTIGVGTRGRSPVPGGRLSFGQQQYVMVQGGDRRGAAQGHRQNDRRTLLPRHRQGFASEHFRRDRPLGKNEDRLQELLRDDGTVLLFRRRSGFSSSCWSKSPAEPSFAPFPEITFSGKINRFPIAGARHAVPLHDAIPLRYLTKKRTSSWARECAGRSPADRPRRRSGPGRRNGDSLANARAGGSVMLPERSPAMTRKFP